MEEQQQKDLLRRQYLLGTLSEDETARLEEAYLADDDAFEEMETTEQELVDAYVRNELLPSEHALIRDRLLTSPRLLEKARFARTLEKSLARRIDRPKPFWKRIFDRFFSVSPKTFGLVLATCSVLFLTFGALLQVQWLRLREQAQQLAAARTAIEQQKRNLGQQSSSDRARAEQLTAELDKQRAQNEKLLADLRAKEQQPGSNEMVGPSVIAFNLIPGISRSGPGQDLKVIPGTKTIQLQLNLQIDDYRRYDVSIRDTARVEVFHRNDLHARRVGPVSTLVIRLPTKGINPGDYGVRVSGVTPSGSIETVEDYQFRLSIEQK